MSENSIFGVVVIFCSIMIIILFSCFFITQCADDNKRWAKEKQQLEEFVYKCTYRQGAVVGSKCFKDGVEI